ncbi:hypothetical protein ASF71_21590 [Deinococcus sp. Leaf326]|nr:hypothetical protein ASF71_21590 [Deinococcus sp. Leaf326]
MDQDNPLDLLGQTLREQSAKRQGDHPANAVTTQEDRSIPRQIQDCIQITCEMSQVPIMSLGFARLSQARKIPEQQAVPVAEVLLCVKPLSAAQAPTVRKQEDRCISWAMRLDVEHSAVRSRQPFDGPPSQRARIFLTCAELAPEERKDQRPTQEAQGEQHQSANQEAWISR